MSRLSKQSHSVNDVRKLLGAFAKESAGMLLFLKNVERMSVFEWEPGKSEPRQVTRSMKRFEYVSNAWQFWRRVLWVRGTCCCFFVAR